jgi:hypothetical protein
MAASGHHLSDPDDVLPFVRSGSKQSADRAIDSALRSVPLPEGLMSRLGRLVRTLRDDADRVDYFGC